MSLLVVGIIGAVVGYFSQLWVSIVFAIIMGALLYRSNNTGTSGVIFFFYAMAFFLGMMLGNLVYLFSHLAVVLSLPDLPDFKSWFIR